LLPPPLSFTLFPYTTLFRSYVFRSLPNCCCPAYAEYRAATLRPTAQSLAPKQKLRLDILVAVTRRRLSRRRPASYHRLLRLQGLDRKSTRLNSSHVAISYAV